MNHHTLGFTGLLFHLGTGLQIAGPSGPEFLLLQKLRHRTGQAFIPSPQQSYLQEGSTRLSVRKSLFKWKTSLANPASKPPGLSLSPLYRWGNRVRGRSCLLTTCHTAKIHIHTCLGSEWFAGVTEGWGGEQRLRRERMTWKVRRERPKSDWAPCMVSWREGGGSQRPSENPRHICEAKSWFCLAYLSKDFPFKSQHALLTSKEPAWNVLSRDNSHSNNASCNSPFFFIPETLLHCWVSHCLGRDGSQGRLCGLPKMGSLFLQPNPQPVNTVWGSLWHRMGQKDSGRISDSGAPTFWNSRPVTAITGELSDNWKVHTHSIMSYLSHHKRSIVLTVTWVGLKEILDMSNICQCHRWQSQFLVAVPITSITHRHEQLGEMET